jgi:hypothetical protein
MLVVANRSVLRAVVSVLLLTGLLGANCAAMLYRPSVGRMKDGFVFWHKGQFHLFSMYTTTGKEIDCRNVWLATSRDGVHWKHVGPVIKDATFNIWAMAVHQVGDRFIMNHGSFSRPGVQNVIRFWESVDLVHWTYMGNGSDLFPDSRWYPADSRLDCMSVVPVVKDGRTRYYGYATGPGGFLVSDDGIHWTGRPQGAIDWGTVPPPPTLRDEGVFEIGGCHEIRGKYYLLGGWFNYMGSTGYGVYTLVADSPLGPFRPDEAAYRLCGNSGRWVALWARFCQTDRDLLVNGYMYDGHTYETGATWLPPLKTARVDAAGHLRLGYWKGNDALKGAAESLNLAACRKAYPGDANRDCRCDATANRLTVHARPERNSTERTSVQTTVAVLDRALDCGKGVVIEGTLQATCRDRRLVVPSAGLYLEEKSGEGTAIMLHGCGRTEIGKLTLGERMAFVPEDTIAPGCAAPAGILPHAKHTFRLLVRKNMFEFYVDDRFIQTFNTSHEPGKIGLTPQRIGFIAENGEGIFENVSIAPMKLDE